VCSWGGYAAGSGVCRSELVGGHVREGRCLLEGRRKGEPDSVELVAGVGRGILLETMGEGRSHWILGLDGSKSGTVTDFGGIEILELR